MILKYAVQGIFDILKGMKALKILFILAMNKETWLISIQVIDIFR